MKVYHPKPLNMWNVIVVRNTAGTFYASIDAPGGPWAEGRNIPDALKQLALKAAEVGFADHPKPL